MKLLSKKEVGQRRVYDIEVEDVHNFYANGVNVHNCATNGGVSVIKDDGTVVDSVRTVSYNRCAFGYDGLYYISISYNDLSYATYADILAGDGFGDIIGSPVADNQEIDLVSYGAPILRAADNLFIGGTVQAGEAKNGVMSHALNYPDFTKGMSALTTSTYNTGWMNGDIKGAFLADTDDTDLVGAIACAMM